MHCVSNVWKSSGTLEAVYVLQFIIECMLHRQYNTFISVSHCQHTAFWFHVLNSCLYVCCMFANRKGSSKIFAWDLWPSRAIKCTTTAKKRKKNNIRKNNNQPQTAYPHIIIQSIARSHWAPERKRKRCIYEQNSRRLKICNRVRLH